MFKSLFKYFFKTEPAEDDALTMELKKIPGFKTKKELEMNPNQNNTKVDIVLKKGEIKTITLPDFGNLKEFILTEWVKKNGDIIKSGDIICVVENKMITMELESFYSGKLIVIAEQNQQLSINSELCKVEGM